MKPLHDAVGGATEATDSGRGEGAAAPAAGPAAGTLADPAAAIARLRDPATIRERSRLIADRSRTGRSRWFVVLPDRLETLADEVAALTRQRFPDLKVPYHSRWRHFEVGGIDRHRALRERLERDHGGDPAAVARALIDLAVVSVLLDAGAGPDWRFREAAGGLEIGRSEGLALASLQAFTEGLFSSRPGDDPLRVDAAALVALDSRRLGELMQVSTANPLVGLEARARLLRSLGSALADRPEIFGGEPRPGGLYDHLQARAGKSRSKAVGVTAAAILGIVLDAFGPIWPHGPRIGGQSLGDCWRHPGLPVSEHDLSSGYVPFHKLSQWLTYSLIEPFEWTGTPVYGLDALTGLPEYRNGGLLIDGGLLVPQPSLAQLRPLTAASEPIIEWRALTVAWIDELAAAVRQRLADGPGGDRAADLPLAAILEGGTWACGRRMAQRLRGGAPPLPVETDGTVF